MKHETIFPVEHLRQRSLPDAPMVVPPQVLERPRLRLNAIIRFWIFPLPRRR